MTDTDSDDQTDESYTDEDAGSRTNTSCTTGTNNLLTSDGTAFETLVVLEHEVFRRAVQSGEHRRRHVSSNDSAS